MRFAKMHGAGNDFVVLDLRDGAPPPTRDRCRTLADRHYGVGCDQILTIEAPRSESAVAAYRIWNADGSNARQCGNGARCIAAWLAREAHRRTQGEGLGDDFVLDSPTGTHGVACLADGGYRIDMGLPEFAPARIPLAGFDAAQDEYVVEGDDTVVAFGAVSMGNPHAVVEVADVAATPVARIGQLLQAHAAFPDSANVGFAEVVARDRIRLRVFERGVGETLACGSGACAAVAVLARRGRVGRDVVVSLPGGELRVAWPDDRAGMTMAGPAAFVFEGEFLA